MRRQSILLSPFLLSAALTIGCASEQQSNEGVRDSQVLVRVNGEDITLLQYERAMKVTGQPMRPNTFDTDIVEKLIDRSLATQKALALGLDRHPDVLVELQEARRDILARAWATREANQTAQASDPKIAQFFSDNPELFADRKIYHLKEWLIQPGPASRAFRTALREGEELERLLVDTRFTHTTEGSRVVIRAAEQLPMSVLPRLSQVSPGEAAIFETPRGIIVYEVISTIPAALRWEHAKSLIAVHLAKVGGKKTVELETKNLRRGARIDRLVEVMPAVDPTREMDSSPIVGELARKDLPQ